jgi:AcrR family transcriptional regulator
MTSAVRAGKRLSVEERREQLVRAALAVALEDGVDAVTIRRVATRAGVSLGLVHYIFEDKGQLLAAVADALRTAIEQAARVRPVIGRDLRATLRAGIRALWEQLTSTAQHQLLTYELTTYGIRHRSASPATPASAASPAGPRDEALPGDLAAAQHQAAFAAVKDVLSEAARACGVRWTTPVGRVARLVQASLDGAVLAWLVDGDHRASIASMELLADQLVALTEPRPPHPARGRRTP